MRRTKRTDLQMASRAMNKLNGPFMEACFSRETRQYIRKVLKY
jgi:hypothetical protein